MRRYAEAPKSVELSTETLHYDEVVHTVLASVQERELAPLSEQRRQLLPQRARIEGWLTGRPPLKLVKVHILLTRDGVSASYATLRRQLFVERTGRAATIVTSNRDTSEWLATFDDVLLSQSAVDRFKNAACDLVVEGESYRPRLKPGVRADDPPPAAREQVGAPHPATQTLTRGSRRQREPTAL